MEKTEVDLMRPRFLVIADYPGLKISVGSILIPNRLDGTINNEWVTPDNNNRCCLYGYDLSEYPHLFRKLSWWEFRKPEEMPEYVKRVESGRVYRLADADEKYEFGFEFDYPMAEHNVLYNECLPATAADYTNYQSSKNQ